jgi:hypothetical protein
MFNSKLKSLVLALGAVVAFAAPAAHANLLVNGDLETAGPTLGGNDGKYCYLGGGAGLGCGTVPGWTGTLEVIATHSGAWGNPSTLAGWNAGFGNLLMGLQNASHAEQAVSLAAGQYTLQWSDAGRTGYEATNYNVLFGSTTLGNFSTTSGQGWSQHTLTFNAIGAGTLSFAGNKTSGDGTAFVDNISLSAVSAVPEPTSVVLTLSGLAALAALRRRRA